MIASFSGVSQKTTNPVSHCGQSLIFTDLVGIVQSISCFGNGKIKHSLGHPVGESMSTRLHYVVQGGSTHLLVA